MSGLTPQSIRATRTAREAMNLLDLASARVRAARTRSEREEASHLAAVAGEQVRKLQGGSQGRSQPPATVRPGQSPEEAEKARVRSRADAFLIATGQKRSPEQEAAREKARAIRREHFGQK